MTGGVWQKRIKILIKSLYTPCQWGYLVGCVVEMCRAVWCAVNGVGRFQEFDLHQSRQSLWGRSND